MYFSKDLDTPVVAHKEAPRAAARARLRRTAQLAQGELAVAMQGPPKSSSNAPVDAMTGQLLQVSSAFFIQQNELREVRDRLQKELARVTGIQEALTQAAHRHQDTVLTTVETFTRMKQLHSQLHLGEEGAAAHGASDADDGAQIQALLQVSSTFLIQQNELQEVCDRLRAELARVDGIQDALTGAAQTHQDSVLTALHNYQSLHDMRGILQQQEAEASSPRSARSPRAAAPEGSGSGGGGGGGGGGTSPLPAEVGSPQRHRQPSWGSAAAGRSCSPSI